MRFALATLVLSLGFLASAMDAAPAKPATENAPVTGVLSYTMKNIDGQEVPLSKYRGKVLLLVNVASKCGNTKQYKPLEEIYAKYADKGLAILGFPANNFGGQEPGTEMEIKSFCTTKFNVTFDLFSKVSVKGDDKCPLYQFLTSKEQNGAFGGDITWNFEKFLVGRDGKVLLRIAPKTMPDAPEVVKAIEEALAAKP
jgi:glutathione peroxidase